MQKTIQKNIYTISLLMITVLAIIAVTFAVAMRVHAVAAVITASPGNGTLQAAVTSASDGDTIQLSAGDYVGDVAYNDNKSLTFLGVAGTVVKPGNSTFPNFAAANAQSITLKNITFEGGNATPAKTGLDLSSIGSVSLENITVKNYLQNGISVTASYSDGTPSGNFSAHPVTSAIFTNVTTDNTAWAGIALYEAVAGPAANLTGVVFKGTTTVGNSAYGIQLGQTSNSANAAVQGVDGRSVNLGVVAFANNTTNVSGGSTIPVLISPDSTVDGQTITAATVGANVTIGTAVVPGVPNTATAKL